VSSRSIDKKAWLDASIPASIPAANGAIEGPWSSVPLWRGLDEAFLCEPDIPKAPPTPRFHVDGTLAISKPTEGPLAASARAQELFASPKSRAKPVKMLLLSAGLGFLGGIVVAWCTGLIG
jgi:hypothetical protein